MNIYILVNESGEFIADYIVKATSEEEARNLMIEKLNNQDETFCYEITENDWIVQKEAGEIVQTFDVEQLETWVYGPLKVEIDIDESGAKFNLLLGNKYIGTINENTGEFAKHLKELETYGPAAITMHSYEDNCGNVASFDPESDFAEYWRKHAKLYN